MQFPLLQIPFELRKYLLIGIAVVILGGVTASVIVVGRSLLTSASSTPKEVPTTPIIIPMHEAASPSAVPTTSLPEIAPASSASEIYPPISQIAPTISSTGWTVTGSGDVAVIPQFSSDFKTLDITFVSTNFSRIPKISYSLSYISDTAISRMVKGSMVPASEATLLENGKPAITKGLALGTCSGLNCVYDTNPHSFNLKVLVSTDNGLTVYLLTLTRATLL